MTALTTHGEQLLEINSVELCNPDAELEPILGGGVTLLDDDDDPIGYAAGEVVEERQPECRP